MSSIDESSADNDSYDGSISTNALEDIRDGIQLHPDINARDARLKICDHIKKTQSKLKGEELSSNSMGKGLQKIFKAVFNWLKNSLLTLG